jgi:hypothetical protein
MFYLTLHCESINLLGKCIERTFKVLAVVIGETGIGAVFHWSRLIAWDDLLHAFL